MEIDNHEAPKPTAGWVDVYVIKEGGEREFKRRVERPPTEDEMHALHSEMCRALAETPTTPLPMDGVVLVPFP
tara:strand:- start:252 stop:470 length:219 start_codon:yes stop_codon:yes gene_type:complete